MRMREPVRLNRKVEKKPISELFVDWIYENQTLLVMFGIGIFFGIFWAIIFMITPPVESGVWYNNHW